MKSTRRVGTSFVPTIVEISIKFDMAKRLISDEIF